VGTTVALSTANARTGTPADGTRPTVTAALDKSSGHHAAGPTSDSPAKGPGASASRQNLRAHFSPSTGRRPSGCAAAVASGGVTCPEYSRPVYPFQTVREAPTSADWGCIYNADVISMVQHPLNDLIDQVYFTRVPLSLSVVYSAGDMNDMCL